MKETVRLGDLARDSITGFEGVVVAITEWLNGCRRIMLQPKALHDGKPIETCSFDEPQIVKVAPEIREVKKTGGPRADPTRQRSGDGYRH